MSSSLIKFSSNVGRDALAVVRLAARSMSTAIAADRPEYNGFVEPDHEQPKHVYRGRRTRIVGKAATARNATIIRDRGVSLLRDPSINKGMAFTLRERQILGLHGLLPPVVFTPEEQRSRIMENVRYFEDDLDKYVYLAGLLDRNEKLFYQVMTENIEELAPIIYTPTVGQACQKYGFIFRKSRGLYITINDLGHVYEILCNWPEQQVKAVVVTDGERILGLGDLGSFGMGIPVGKLALYTAMGGVPPCQCLPVVLDVGTNNESLVNLPSYIGLKHKRVRGRRYDQLVDEFLQAVTRRYGQSTLIQFEDFANNNAFRLLDKYRDRYLTFNDDIQGTASVALAGIIAAMRITQTKLSEHTYLFQGAGEASIGIANLLVMAMMEEGVPRDKARSKIWMVDSKGLLTTNRQTGGITPHKAVFAKDFKDLASLEEICTEVKPTVAIGAAAIPGAFTEQFIQMMGQLNERPIIFALSNPTSKAECTAEQAYNLTDGRAIFASGSPFDPVTVNGVTLYPGQGNNAYIFPGVALGAIVSGVRHVTDGMFLKASQALAGMVTEEDMSVGRIYPPLKDIREVSTQLAASICQYAYDNGMATAYPEPENMEDFVRQHQYNTSYENFVPHTYPWPGHTEGFE
jgi:malate dehydrogenase (oxaloacetate-decarboxylating)(NADP+)